MKLIALALAPTIVAGLTIGHAVAPKASRVTMMGAGGKGFGGGYSWGDNAWVDAWGGNAWAGDSWAGDSWAENAW